MHEKGFVIESLDEKWELTITKHSDKEFHKKANFEKAL